VRDLVPSGRFAQLARLTRKALRLYNDLGVLRPAHVGADNGYRYYSLSQLEDAHRVARLRELGMPLEAIGKALRVWGTPELAEMLRAHREELLRRAAAVQLSVQSLDAMLQAPPAPYEVSSKRVEAQPYLGTRAWCDPDDACTFIPAAQRRLLAAAREVFASPAGASLARYHDDEREDAWDVEVCLPVTEAPIGDLPEGIYQGTLPAGTVAFTVHAGDCGGSRGMQDAYAAVWRWVHEHGHQTVGGPSEIYLFDEFNTSDPADHRTEIAWMLET
jgi:DNA-binding transcriptional MerR regulator/effector-binding domain-containing protein